LTDAQVADNLTINNGTINNTPIGQTTPAAGTFTNLQVNGTLNDGSGTGTTGQVLAVASDGTPEWKTLSTLETDPQVGPFTTTGQVAVWDQTNGYLAPGSITDNGTTVSVGSNFSVTVANGNTTTNGNLTVNGNTTLGNTSTDNVTFNATVASNIVPDATANNRDLGSSSSYWNYIYANGIRSQSDGFRLIYYPTIQKAFFDIVDPGTNKPLVTIGPLTNSATLENGGVAVNERTNGNLRAGIGWNGTAWAAGVGNQDTSGSPHGVQFLFNPNNNPNDPRIVVLNGSTTPVFLVDKEGDVTASSITVTGNTTLGNAATDVITINGKLNDGSNDGTPNQVLAVASDGTPEWKTL
jgi:hypothetical protein